MYVPLHVGVFFLLVFFLKVAFACIDGMCSNFILQVFSFCFHTKREFSWEGGGGGGGRGRVSIRFIVAAPREDVLQRYSENSVSLLEKLRNIIFRLAISGHLPFKCYVYVKGLQEK